MVNVIIPEDKYIHSYRYKLYPTNEQKAYLEKCIYINRCVYNWALEQENIQYEKFKSGESKYGFLDRMELERLFTIYRNNPGNEYLLEVPHITERMALWTLYKSFMQFFRGQSKRPIFKTRKNIETFYFKTRADRMFFEGSKVRIEGLPKNDMIELKFNTGYTKETTPHIYSPIINKDILGNYWISYGIIQSKNINYFRFTKIKEMDRAIGIDLNLAKRFQLSTGEYFTAPDISKKLKRYRKMQRRCRKDRILENKQKRANSEKEPTVSNRSLKRLYRKRKLGKRIANISENFIQTTTKRIINMHPKAIVMEDLNVVGMQKKKYIGNQIFGVHCNFYRCRAVMEYKCNMYNIPFILAPRNFPSSQLCSNCGHQHIIGSTKIYKCPNCGLKIDRDLNAALNLEKLAYNQNKIESVVA